MPTTGGDLYLLENIPHDWHDTAAEILTTCRRAVSGHATLLIIEHLIGPPNERPDLRFCRLIRKGRGPDLLEAS